ncbi:TlpA family protein disulfide reductase [Winogradskyella undariae]|uniref:TlpA family protein disulfide reductase n=1 Tax=Winogradskyella undariae TaxID=1285465 RepID=UPI0015C97D84|nr:TlpA disulfide reductase family protein [Winogradskyella undariae]
MKRLITLCVAILFVSCKKEVKIDYVLFSGKIDNPKQEILTILKGSKKIKEVSITNEGTFIDTLKIETGYYNLSHGNETTAMYLSPGDEINVTLNTEKFDETIKYSGLGSENSNFLAEKYMANENADINYIELFSKEETEFLKELNTIKNSKLEFLKKQKDLDLNFITLEEKNIEYDYLSSIQSYPSAHGYYTKKEDFKPSLEFLKPLDAIDYNNEVDYNNIDNYKNLVQRYYSNKINETENPKEVFETINKQTFPSLKTDLAKSLSYQITPNNENNEAYYNGIITMSSDEKFKEDLTNKYNKVKKLTKGMPSPKFVNYENHKGGTTSLDDLKGQFVYIDVWATWCGPCIKEIPSLKKVEKQYHGKNIAFISASIDREKDHDKWVKMVTDKELGGIQLMADKDWKSLFVTEYAIDGIPRFILIDPDGNIVSADAPRPSNPELIELFDELKI